MLADGTLPAGLTVRHRRLVKIHGAADLTTDRTTKNKKNNHKKDKKHRKKVA
jgi:hypothetical protein